MLRVRQRPSLISNTLTTTTSTVTRNPLTKLGTTKGSKKCLKRIGTESFHRSKMRKKRDKCTQAQEISVEFHPQSRDSSISPSKDQVHMPQTKKKRAQALTKTNKPWFSTRRTRSRDSKICPMWRWDSSQILRMSISQVWNCYLTSIISCNRTVPRTLWTSTKVRKFHKTRSEMPKTSQTKNH